MGVRVVTGETDVAAGLRKPRLLILYHYNSSSPEELYDEMLARYAGHFVIGRDLDVY